MEIIPITTLWLPILVSGVLVFVASSIINMLLPYHRNDFSAVPREDAVMDALRPFELVPGDYAIPRAGTPADMGSDEFLAKVEKGPAAFFTVLPRGAMFNMGSQLTQWFAYTLLVGVVTAYVGGRMLGTGTEYMVVFRLTATVTFASYAMALMQRSIWFHQRWSTTLKFMFDGLVYASLTGGVFGWLWPV